MTRPIPSMKTKIKHTRLIRYHPLQVTSHKSARPKQYRMIWRDGKAQVPTKNLHCTILFHFGSSPRFGSRFSTFACFSTFSPSVLWRRLPSTSQIHGAKWLKTKRLAQGMDQNHHSHRFFEKRRTRNTHAWPTNRRSLCQLVRRQWKVPKKKFIQEM